MKFKFLANTIRNKRFDYSPMYFDERKERLELKKKEFAKLDDKNLDPDDRQKILRQNMQQSWSRAKQSQHQRTRSNYRILFLIVIILVLGYFVFNGLDDVDTVVKKLW